MQFPDPPTTFQREGLTHLPQVLFDSVCYVAASLRDEAQQALQLVDPELQRFGSPCLEGLPGPLYDQLFPRHLEFQTNNKKKHIKYKGQMLHSSVS